jgi:hypothetical protein
MNTDTPSSTPPGREDHRLVDLTVEVFGTEWEVPCEPGENWRRGFLEVELACCLFMVGPEAITSAEIDGRSVRVTEDHQGRLVILEPTDEG